MSIQITRVVLLILFTGLAGTLEFSHAQTRTNNSGWQVRVLTEVNIPETPFNSTPIAITGARLIDGTGGPVVENSIVLVKDNRIIASGKQGEVGLPEYTIIYDASGKTLLPGFIDAHYHSVNNNEALHMILQNGTTSFRDPGHPFRFYQSLNFATEAMPRAFLTGAHLDGYPGVYKQQAVLVQNAGHAQSTVYEHVQKGGSGIKIYFRLPLDYFKPIIQAARYSGVPVFAHLELVPADISILAGLNGIEHVTSCGTALATPEEAAKFQDTVYKNSDARREWRYRLWANLDLNSDRADKLIDLMVSRGVYLTPTLAVFERQAGDERAEDYEVKAFQNMVAFVSMAHKAGVKIVTSSHTSSRYSEPGWTYQREMELLADAGMSPMEIIHASTLVNAQYFRSEERIGSIEPGKLADLILIDGNPLENISQVKNIERVMLNGKWVE